MFRNEIKTNEHDIGVFIVGTEYSMSLDSGTRGNYLCLGCSTMHVLDNTTIGLEI